MLLSIQLLAMFLTLVSLLSVLAWMIKTDRKHIGVQVKRIKLKTHLRRNISTLREVMLHGTIHNDDFKRIMLCAKNRRCESPDSLRSKRFRLVSEQRKTGFGRARNETRALSPLFYLHHFSRSL